MTEVGLEVIGFVFSLLLAAAGAIFGTISYRSKKKIDIELSQTQKVNEDYQRLLEEEKTRSYRNMIVQEIEPLIEEIHRVKTEANSKIEAVENHIKEDEKEFEHRIDDLKQFHNDDKHEVDNKLADLNQKHEDNLAKILESYKFRFIQLCKIHLKDNYITTEEFEQIVAFYDLYSGLGGNGQAAEYFERVKKLGPPPTENE